MPALGNHPLELNKVRLESGPDSAPRQRVVVDEWDL